MQKYNNMFLMKKGNIKISDHSPTLFVCVPTYVVSTPTLDTCVDCLRLAAPMATNAAAGAFQVRRCRVVDDLIMSNKK